MTSDRKRKKAARSYKDSRSLAYYDALQGTSAGRVARSFPRREQATANLSAPAGDLLSELARFFGLRPPTGAIGVELVEATLIKLDEVPPRRVALCDDLTTAIAERPHLGPPIPSRVRIAARFITALLSHLADTQLVAAAMELGVSSGGVRHAALLAGHEYRRAVDVSRPADEPHMLVDIDSPEDRAARDAESRAQEDCVARLRDRSGATWESVDRAVLRRAVAGRLAALGDAYLTVSEAPLMPLTWRRLPDGSRRADCSIPAAPRPLSALVKESIRYSDDPISVPEFYLPDQRQSAITYTCYVGVFGDAAEDFDRHDIEGHLPSELAAEFAAARIIERIAADPQRARSHPNSRPLVERTTLAPGDPTTLTFDLGSAVDGITDLYMPEDPDPADDWWEPEPHIDNAGHLNSVTALALDSCGFPWPKRTDPACRAAVQSEVFQAYLGSQGVRMTDLARDYLTGTAAAGPGAQTLSARHTAGMNAVLTNHQLLEVVGELKRHYPAIEDWILWITEPHAAAGYLTNLGALADLLSGFDESGYGE
jgi:hypothetical protein